MVVLTAAAIGAGAYGVFKGGQAAAKQAKEGIKEFGRQQKRSASLKDFKNRDMTGENNQILLRSICAKFSGTTACRFGIDSSITIR